MINNVLEYLEKSAALYSDKIAFQDENCFCTYKELINQAKTIGSVLAEKGISNSPVPVFMEKSVAAIALFMGIVYSGNFYVMLDTKHPGSRLQSIIETLHAKILLTRQDFEEELNKLEFSGEIFRYEELIQGEIQEEILQEIRKNSLDINPLYGIFTSGSTGIPKGVVVSHRSVIEFLENFTQLFHITENDVIGNQAPFDFDVSVKDIYAALKTGASMYIIPRRLFSMPAQLLDCLCEVQVTTLIWAVSALCIITTLNGFDYKIPPFVNKVLFSGEVMPIKHLNKWRQAYPEAVFVNLYGPTEITCNCTYYIVDREFEPGEVLPMGQAFPNEKVFLLDENDREIAGPGIKGEICVSGTALSLGYFSNQEQTKKVFVQNPLNPYFLETIYRTGDMASYNESGELYFAARRDNQIKHMGQRIELGEIESGMDRIEGINRVCCMFQESTNKIIGFYEGTIEKRQIVKELRNILPAYMIPNVFHRLESFPITKNGKIDRGSLENNYLKES